jgi:hypothetical protein
LGLKDLNHFLTSSESSSGTGGQVSFDKLIGLASHTLASDLLNILGSVWGVTHPQTGGASTDAEDKTKHVGSVDHDHAAKTAIHSVLKPDQG